MPPVEVALAAISARVVKHAGHMSDLPSRCSRRPVTAAQFLDRPHFQAPEARRWKPRGHLDGLVKVPGIDEKEPANLFLRLGIGTVSDGHLPVLNPNGYGHLDWLEGFRRNEVAALLKLLAVDRGFVRESIEPALGQSGQLLLLVATKEQVFHGSNLRSYGENCRLFQIVVREDRNRQRTSDTR